MSASTQHAPRAEGRREARESEGSGWILFAGAMLAILGTMNVIYGIGAIDDANVFVANSQFVFSDLNTWGWLLLIAGTVQFLAAFSIWNGTTWGTWVGILSASVNSVFQLMFLPAFPFLALALFSLNILVIYGLIAYGGGMGAR